MLSEGLALFVAFANGAGDPKNLKCSPTIEVGTSMCHMQQTTCHMQQTDNGSSSRSNNASRARRRARSVLQRAMQQTTGSAQHTTVWSVCLSVRVCVCV